MENSEGKLLGVTELRWIGLSDACQMRLAALPPEALALYRSRVDPVARKWYEEGVRRRDHRLLSQVVRQAFASRWGDKALLALGEIALESGDFTAARWNWERILPAAPPPGVTNTWPGYPDTTLDPAMVRARLVLGLDSQGASERAREELAALVRLDGEARGRLGGTGSDVRLGLGRSRQTERALAGPDAQPRLADLRRVPGEELAGRPHGRRGGRRLADPVARAIGSAAAGRRAAGRRGRRRCRAAGLASGGRRRSGLRQRSARDRGGPAGRRKTGLGRCRGDRLSRAGGGRAGRPAPIRPTRSGRPASR